MTEGSWVGLDRQLAAFAPAESALRLRLGQVLEAVGRGAYFDLGFSSMGAYVLERCERSARWAEAARCLARRLEQLPELRQALATGRLSWSMSELVARVAQPGAEAQWLDAARSRTVRQMRILVSQALSKGHAGSVATEGVATEGVAAEGVAAEGVAAEGVAAEGVAAEDVVAEAEGGAADPSSALPACEEEDEEMCTLTCTVPQEDAWLLEATRGLLEHLGVQGSDAQVEALLAEAQGTLFDQLPRGEIDPERLSAVAAAQERWKADLSRWRAQAEARSEARILCGLRAGPAAPEPPWPDQGGGAGAAASVASSLQCASSHELDDRVRELARSLARHELELSRLILRFHRVDGWRRLGYASEAQYARERLGISRSSMRSRRVLAARLEALRGVAESLGSGQLGVEAALQIVRVATPATELAWIERARQRTIKHLREEVGAALMALRFSCEVDCPPPTDAEMFAFFELERAVVSGRACQPASASVRDGVGGPVSSGGGSVVEPPASDRRRAWGQMLTSLTAWLAGGIQMSALGGAPGRAGGRWNVGRVKLRLRVSRGIFAWWRELRRQAQPRLPAGVSWLRFLCLSMWQPWRHLLGREVAYGHIYVRDRQRCTSPVCSRMDVTPHHLQFRSAGGGEEDGNITTVCTWCHLCGVHGGRIRATGTARHIRWELGSPDHPCLVVDGRQRVAA